MVLKTEPNFMQSAADVKEGIFILRNAEDAADKVPQHLRHGE